MKASIKTMGWVAYEALRAYSQSLGDNSGVMWICADGEIKRSMEEGVQSLIKNKNLTPEQIHTKWAEEKVRLGWKHGVKKDRVKRTHPHMVPWDKLPDVEKVKNAIFRNVVLGFLEVE